MKYKSRVYCDFVTVITFDTCINNYLSSSVHSLADCWWYIPIELNENNWKKPVYFWNLDFINWYIHCCMWQILLKIYSFVSMLVHSMLCLDQCISINNFKRRFLVCVFDKKTISTHFVIMIPKKMIWTSFSLRFTIYTFIIQCTIGIIVVINGFGCLAWAFWWCLWLWKSTIWIRN